MTPHKGGWYTVASCLGQPGVFRLDRGFRVLDVWRQRWPPIERLGRSWSCRGMLTG